MLMSDRKGLNKMETAARLWVEGESFGAIAQRLRLSRTTVYRWRSHPLFAQLASDHRHRTMVKAFDRCLDLQHRAIDTLEGLLKAKSPHVRLKAAQLVTEMNWKYFVEKEASDKAIRIEEEVLKLTKLGIPHDHRPDELASADPEVM
jgi:hypothetical protein